MPFDPWSIAELVAIGLFAGAFGGALGVGGSILMIPLMTFALGPNQHLYQGAAMIVNFFVAVPSVIQHGRAGAILKPVVRWTIPTAAICVLGGVWLSSGHWFQGRNEVWLSRIFGAFLLYESAYNLYRLFAAWSFPDIDDAAARRIPAWRIVFGVGAPTGIVGGLLGIGGGAMAVPLQQSVLRMPLRRAIANSSATIVLLSAIGASYKNYTNARMGIPVENSLFLAALMVPTAIIGAFIGGRLTHVMPKGILRVVVVGLLFWAGLGLIMRKG